MIVDAVYFKESSIWKECFFIRSRRLSRQTHRPYLVDPQQITSVFGMVRPTIFHSLKGLKTLKIWKLLDVQKITNVHEQNCDVEAINNKQIAMLENNKVLANQPK